MDPAFAPDGPAKESGDEDLAVRALAMDCDLVMVRVIAQSAFGQAWALLRDDGSMSPGVAQETAVFRKWKRRLSRQGTWAQWEQMFRGAGLHALWKSL
jgi:hypothetical protein